MKPALFFLLGAALLVNSQSLNSTSAILNASATATSSPLLAASTTPAANPVYPVPTAFSPPFYPAPDTRGEGAWKAATAKARARISTWTLEQKVNITTGVGWQNGSCIGNIASQPELGFDGLCLQDSPLGVRRSDFVSVFPAGVNAAATFDRGLIRARGLAMAEEFKGKGIHVALGPMMNPYRAVQAGRNWEGFGGDPYLQGEAAYETIKGMQTPGKGVQAVAKHYIANEQERNRTESSSNVNDRTLHEVYLAPFLRSIQADVASVMCSYNQINGSWGCQNSALLNGVLKTELGFQGYVMSDWQAHESGVGGALAGLDMSMPGDIIFKSNTSYWGYNLTESVRNGSVPESRVDDMATRILAGYYLLEQEQDWSEVNFKSWDLQLDPLFNKHVNVQADHYKLIREMGAASVVLLKNDNNALPLKPSLRDVSLIGNGACPPWKGPNGWNNRAGADGNLVIGWGSGTAQLPYLIPPLEAIQQRARKNATTVIWTCDNWDNTTIATAATGPEAALVFISSNSGEDNAVVDGNYGDRKNISAWLNGDYVVESVASRNKNTIVIINSVGPILMPWIDHPNITAIVWAGLPGQESGNALLDVLYGDYNPSGRLPYTIAKNQEDYPVPYINFQTTLEPAHPQINYTEELLVDYRWFHANNITPLFPFGFGLSYTAFEYSDLEIVEATVSKRHLVEEGLHKRANTTEVGSSVAEWLHETRWSVEFDVTNTGSVNGCDVPLMFVTFPEAAGEPPRVLRGFERINLDPGATTRVSLPLSIYSLSIWDVVSQRWVKPEGEFKIVIAKHADDTQLESTL
ncbi:glycosyl hydrolase family 3 N terminal domain-containing protein [Mrakia frigida]|uniref:beta-glucosidase n=1 Tax=Mrakia frigida TaxID=29902 RepID=UPI003FCBFFB5